MCFFLLYKIQVFLSNFDPSITRYFLKIHFQVFCLVSKIKLATFSRWWPEGSLFNSYYTEVERRSLLLSLDCSTLPLICTFYRWVLSKEVSSTIFKVFAMTRPGIEPRSSGPLANTLPTSTQYEWNVFQKLHYIPVWIHIRLYCF